MSDATDTAEISDWTYLGREIKRRTVQPFSDAPFVFYVFLAIISFGCLGIWVEVVKIQLQQGTASYEGLLTAMATFFPALIGSASLQLILSSTGKADKILVSFALIACFASFGSVVLISVFHAIVPTVCFWAAIGFSVFAIWLWWFTNGDDPTYKNAPIDAPTGGDTGRKLKGNTAGFKD